MLNLQVQESQEDFNDGSTDLVNDYFDLGLGNSPEPKVKFDDMMKSSSQMASINKQMFQKRSPRTLKNIQNKRVSPAL